MYLCVHYRLLDIRLIYFVRASRNCDLFTLDKADLDTCLSFDKDLSTKIFEKANIKHQTLQRNVKASSAMINRKREMSAAMSVKKSALNMEDIELGVMDNGGATKATTKDVENSDAEFPWFKYPIYFTICHQSYFIKVLTFISVLFNIVLAIIIPYEV